MSFLCDNCCLLSENVVCLFIYCWLPSGSPLRTAFPDKKNTLSEASSGSTFISSAKNFTHLSNC